MRKSLALAAGLGLVSSVVVYALTFFGLTMEHDFRWIALLHVGVFLLIGPMFLLEFAAFQSRTFLWQKFTAAMPGWALPSIKLFGGLAIAHFVLFLVLTRATSPEIKDGHYVLDNHGQIAEVLSKDQYFSLKGWELRMFAAYWIFFYWVPALYWWFPRGAAGEGQENMAKHRQPTRFANPG